MKEVIQLKALKYPNIPHYEWEGEVLEKTDDYIILFCKSKRKLVHHTKNNVFTMKNASIEYFSFKHWYTAAMEIEDQRIVSYYCNVAKPSVLEGHKLSFVDLDLDLIKKKNENWKVVDEDEFEENSVKFQYPEKLKQEALIALEHLKMRANEGCFPFNKEIIDIIK